MMHVLRKHYTVKLEYTAPIEESYLGQPTKCDEIVKDINDLLQKKYPGILVYLDRFNYK